MKILFDQGAPVPLRARLVGHAVTTASEKGWADLDNGRLLAAAEAEFDVLITTDQNLRYQQNLTDGAWLSWSFRRRAGRGFKSTSTRY